MCYNVLIRLYIFPMNKRQEVGEDINRGGCSASKVLDLFIIDVEKYPVSFNSIGKNYKTEMLN